MLRLMNIEKTNKTIRAEYTPEDSEEVGMFELSREDAGIVMSKKTSYDEPVECYLRHAAKALRKMMNEQDIHKTRLVMWY